MSFLATSIFQGRNHAGARQARLAREAFGRRFQGENFLHVLVREFAEH
jgi:hypothetical protein